MLVKERAKTTSLAAEDACKIFHLGKMDRGAHSYSQKIETFARLGNCKGR